MKHSCTEQYVGSHVTNTSTTFWGERRVVCLAEKKGAKACWRAENWAAF